MPRILILWNQIDEDVYAHFRREGRTTLAWDPTRTIQPWDTVDEEMQLIHRALVAGGHEVRTVNIRDDLDGMVAAIKAFAPDAIMNLVEFLRDDAELEHHVPALFELLGVEYTGNRPLALSLCQKKPLAKALIAQAGVPVPRGVVIESVVAARAVDLRFPLIVKPAYDDASNGIDAGSVVHDHAALAARIDRLLAERRRAAIVEEYIEGREIHCAILGDQPLPLYEVCFDGSDDEHGRPLPRIITYRAKWDPYSREHHATTGVCPVPDLAPATVAHLQAVALRAYRALGCRDYARVDMRLDPDTGEPHVLEVNPNPDLAASCAFTAACAASGRDYHAMINEIVGLAVARRLAPTPTVTGIDLLLHEHRARPPA